MVDDMWYTARRAQGSASPGNTMYDRQQTDTSAGGRPLLWVSFTALAVTLFWWLAAYQTQVPCPEQQIVLPESAQYSNRSNK